MMGNFIVILQCQIIAEQWDFLLKFQLEELFWTWQNFFEIWKKYPKNLYPNTPIDDFRSSFYFLLLALADIGIQETRTPTPS